jgi:putative DNA primase/helicase
MRWVPALRRPDGTDGPAMVARVNGLDGELIALHRTWIERDASGVWRRRDRASLGPVAGGAVRLAPARETLLVAEGIETTLSAMELTGQPGWAALSSIGLERLLLPAEAQDVMIFADRDRGGAGERAARRAAARWVGEGRRVRLVIPDRPGADANDLLREACHAA